MIEQVPFFSRPEIVEVVADIAQRAHLLIYAGAGATVDQSGVDWAGLVNGLLEKVLPDDAVREQLVALDPQRAASVAAELFVDASAGESPDAARQAMAKRLQVLLYEQASWSVGTLTPGIAECLWAWFARYRGTDPADWSANLVTPNFDAYLYEGLTRAAASRSAGQSAPMVRQHISRSGSPVRYDQVRTETQALNLIYLHGRVPRSGNIVLPVLSEADYAQTRRASGETLRSAFKHSNVLIAGSSLTDPPLIEALLATKKVAASADLQRWAIMPLQGLRLSRSSDDIEAVTRNFSLRFRHLGVEAIYPEYFMQVAQFLHEVRTASLAQATGLTYHEFRYGVRLKKWWQDWAGSDSELLTELRQRSHHEVIRRTVAGLLRNHLLPSSGEDLKAEVWLRWKPSRHERQLRLWASSVGTWPNWNTTRRAVVDPGSQYFAVQSYCDGRAKLAYPTAQEMPSSALRWRSYLSVPIWHEHEWGPVPVGAVSLASTRGRDNTCLSERAASRLRKAGALLALLGQAITNPGKGSLQSYERDLTSLERLRSA